MEKQIYFNSFKQNIRSKKFTIIQSLEINNEVIPTIIRIKYDYKFYVNIIFVKFNTNQMYFFTITEFLDTMKPQ